MRCRWAVVLLLALAACRHSSSSGSGSEPAHWAKAGPAPVAATLTYPLELSIGGGRVWVVASNRDVMLLDRGKPRIVKSLGWVSAIAADEEGAWIAAHDELGGKTSALWRLLPDADPIRVAEDVTYVAPAGAAIVIWRTGGAFVREPSGAEHPLGAIEGRIRAVGDTLYVGDRRGVISRMPLAGGPLEQVADFGALVVSFDVAGDTIYASTDRGIYTMSTRGGPRQMLAEHLDDPREVVADGEGGVYVLTYGTTSGLWGHSTNDDGELLHIDRNRKITALASDIIGAGRIALTKDTVYATDVYGGRLLAVPR
ncbi:MAG TPA: hypothetical protein VMZ53_27330 [Kofleriaceae bacterium]|nr:hypothetical protein [Kofleriaceae bacterium]